jgi:hypothetical protein
MRFFGPETRKTGSADNHEENGSSGGGRRRALTVAGSFLRADRRHQHRFGAAIILICSFRAIGSLFLP